MEAEATMGKLSGLEIQSLLHDLQKNYLNSSFIRVTVAQIDYNRKVQLDYTPVMEVFYMMFERC